MGLMIDLVILNTKDTGYAHELNEKIHKVINLGDCQNWVNQRGGIFILTSSQLDKNTQILLQTVSRVIIDCKSHGIEGHLKQADITEPHLPVFNPTNSSLSYDHQGVISIPENLILTNGFGGFTPDGKEYQIYLQNYPYATHHQGKITPKPWVNIIANKNFGFSVSESGSGYAWATNSGENRLTPWTNDPVSDPSGESLYIRDEITGKVWSPTPLPAGQKVDYLVSHGQGYTIFKSSASEGQDFIFTVNPKLKEIPQFNDLKIKIVLEGTKSCPKAYSGQSINGYLLLNSNLKLVEFTPVKNQINYFLLDFETYLQNLKQTKNSL